MDFIRLFKIRCHLCQKLICSNSYVNGKSELIADLIFDLMCQCHRVRIDQVRAAHIEENFIDGK